jgi:hypothetical protein
VKDFTFAFIFTFTIMVFAGSAGADNRLWRGVCKVESNGRPKAVGDHGTAAGIAQISPAMVKECNRLAGRKKFTLADRWSVSKSKKMFDLYMSQWPKASMKVKAMRWNGGPNGEHKVATARYWKKIVRVIS